MIISHGESGCLGFISKDKKALEQPSSEWINRVNQIRIGSALDAEFALLAVGGRA
jgi:hypothetical protein